MDIATLRLIMDAVLAIEKASDNVEQNGKDCESIKGRAEKVLKNLSRVASNEQLMEDSAVSSAVVALGKILDEAQELVKKCQVKRNIICVYWTAGKLSRKLSRMNKSISDTNSDLMCAIMCSLTQRGHRPPVPEPVRVPSSAPDGEMNNHHKQIADIADQINARMKMVRKNREECFEIDKRAGKVTALLPRLENTDMMKDPEMSADLEKLVETFQHAYELVTACQGRNFLMIRPAQGCQGGNGRTDGELSKELHQVLDQMVLDLDDMTEISIRYAKGNREATTPAVQFTATLMVSQFVVRLKLARQRSKGMIVQSMGHLKEISHLDASFKAEPEEIEAVASESISLTSSSNLLPDEPSLLQGGTTTEAPGPSS
ncbi:uncharacterized protein [Setaria viridis]|uniref:Mixed lineage kinase domain-containing protein n=1 Tax=Setaria viridis TaxID=4556 RepID=A0A4U6VG30_SETVI|nr:uncharacterized protein LOC117850038 [Setaria viridis]XP_034587708.1 uncharacterized protein LOC117850038 [Setaria viridis]TKW28531.1 hypothetical protein SEVIR_3G334100v2 [Setaria viridis]TKW28532.1 hypothetical protein SEVIR_3G334100v2 [Setaria viridis]